MSTNNVWKDKLIQISEDYNYFVSPRGMNVYEVIDEKASYIVDMPAYVTLINREVNYPFMFAEAAWIISGSNRLGDITPYMKYYANFSDDGVFLKGAYGPKVIDQLPYVVDTIIGDNDTRQAVINIWRERPGLSKDIPCTLSMQFLLRENKLHATVTMRSNDIVKGFTYDVFTFSMVALSVLKLLNARGLSGITLGQLRVNAGSLHLYESDYPNMKKWILAESEFQAINDAVKIITEAETYEDLIRILWTAAKVWKDNK